MAVAFYLAYLPCLIISQTELLAINSFRFVAKKSTSLGAPLESGRRLSVFANLFATAKRGILVADLITGVLRQLHPSFSKKLAVEHLTREVWDTVVMEFSDLGSVRDATSMVIRLLVAAILGGLLGYEREQHGKSAGVRTHMLVALGSAMFILTPQQTSGADADLSRIQQGLVAGVGFLGAGSIIKGHVAGDVKGLTTAASIWLTAAIGMAAGMGREASAVLCTLMALMIMALIPRIIRPSKNEEDES